MQKMARGGPHWSETVRDVCSEGTKLGYDPTLVSVEAIKARKEYFAKKDITLVPIDTNLVDVLWTDRPVVSLE